MKLQIVDGNLVKECYYCNGFYEGGCVYYSIIFETLGGKLYNLPKVNANRVMFG